MIAIINHQKNVSRAPPYAHIIENIEDNGFTYQPGNRYPIVWFKGFHNLFASVDPTENNCVNFGNTSAFGEFVRNFVNTGITDDGHEAFAYIYYPVTKDLYCIALHADEARFGGIVLQPAHNHPLVKKFTRHHYLMNK